MKAIDADALKEAIQEYTHTLYHDDRPDLDYEYIDIDDLNYVVDSAPMLTREQVDNSTYLSIYNEGYLAGLKERAKKLEGKWVRKEDDICYWYECSKCGCKASKDFSLNFVFSKYCPDCGTKMKGDAE